MKSELTRQINDAFDNLIDSFNSIETEKVNVVPFASSWTPAQVVQHVILSCSGFEKLLNGGEADAQRPYDQGVAATKDMFESPDRMKSPKEIDPEMRHYDRPRQITKLRALKVGVSSAVEKNDLTKLATGFEFPGGHLTKYEAAYFMLYHTQRHTRQLYNIHRFILTKQPLAAR